MKRVTTGVRQALWGLAAWLVLVVVTVPVLVLLAVLPGETRRRRLARGAARLIVRLCGVDLRIRGLEQLPPGPCIVVANHSSYLDGLILTAALPPRFGFVIKREMTRVPVVHFLLRRVGSEFVERESNSQGTRDARRIIKRAAIGHSLVFFPEGTFEVEPGLARFRLGAFNAAVRGQVPVVPLVMPGNRTMLPGDAYLPRRVPLAVHIHPPVWPSMDAGAGELAARCRAIMLADLGEPDLAAADTAAWRRPAPTG